MANEPDATVVPGTGQVYIAPVGASLPAGPNASISGFTDLGYTTEEGVGIQASQEIYRLRALQGRADIRRERQSDSFQLTVQLLQWDENTLPFAIGGEVDSVTGGYEFTPYGLDDALVEWSLIAHVVDGERVHRFMIPRGNVTGGVDSTFARTSAATLAVTFEALADVGSTLWKYQTNSDAFAEAS